MKWRFFVAACLLGAYLLDVFGVPLAAIGVCAALGLAWNLAKSFGLRSAPSGTETLEQIDFQAE